MPNLRRTTICARIIWP